MSRRQSKQKPPPDAFVSKHVLDGIKLHPWTPARIIAAQSMGMLFPNIGTEGRDQHKRTGNYPGMLKDIAICLWLCTQTADQVDEADVAPSDAYAKARAWSIARGIHEMASDEFNQAKLKFSEIVLEAELKRTRPRPPLGEEDDDPPN